MTGRPITRATGGARALAAVLIEAAIQADLDAARETSRAVADALRALAMEYRASARRLETAGTLVARCALARGTGDAP